MSLVVIPRGMLHDCVHELTAELHADHACAGHEEDGALDGHGSVQAGCAICDLHLLTAVQEEVPACDPLEVIAAPVSAPETVRVYKAPRQVPADRGPPALA